MSLPAVGSPTPSFSGIIQDGTSVSLESLRGRRIALYFYPRDNTLHCTQQACNLRDHFAALKAADITIVGVSDDPPRKHRKFADRYDLPFPLIADTDHAVLEAYGMRVEKSMFGRRYMGTQRSTFLIDEQGVLRHIILKPKVGDHAREIIAAFEALEN